MFDDATRARFREGLVIPAHPLALTADKQFDEDRQRALTDYYIASEVGGLAVGVHTTQFEIHDPAVGLYEPVLRLAADQVASHQAATPPLLVAGVLGPTDRAVREAELAASLAYDLALVATPGWGDASEEEILRGVAAISDVLPVVGFYLQKAVSGRTFGYDFWRRYAEIPGVVGIKIAPFDRYATGDVIRAVVNSGRATPQGDANDIALYTGNDDSIVTDLITPFPCGDDTVHIVGGLLGQWAVGTPAAVALHRRIRQIILSGSPIPADLLTEGVALTDANAAVFDSANDFVGSIAGVNEVLARDGVLAGNWCLADRERLSPGQAEELDRVRAAYPWLWRMP